MPRAAVRDKSILQSWIDYFPLATIEIEVENRRLVPKAVKCLLESTHHVAWQEPNICGSYNKREPVCDYEASMYLSTPRYKTYQEQQCKPNLWEVAGQINATNGHKET